MEPTWKHDLLFIWNANIVECLAFLFANRGDLISESPFPFSKSYTSYLQSLKMFTQSRATDPGLCLGHPWRLRSLLQEEGQSQGWAAAHGHVPGLCCSESEAPGCPEVCGLLSLKRRGSYFPAWAVREKRKQGQRYLAILTRLSLLVGVLPFPCLCMFSTPVAFLLGY
jgi:hypothetical protein